LGFGGIGRFIHFVLRVQFHGLAKRKTGDQATASHAYFWPFAQLFHEESVLYLGIFIFRIPFP
jgi:hypothetical protein